MITISIYCALYDSKWIGPIKLVIYTTCYVGAWTEPGKWVSYLCVRGIDVASLYGFYVYIHERSLCWLDSCTSTQNERVSMFNRNGQHKYHTANKKCGVKLVFWLHHCLFMSMWVNYQSWHYNRDVLSLLNNVLLFTFCVLYTVINSRFILLTRPVSHSVLWN
jgi:hypothetical protein